MKIFWDTIATYNSCTWPVQAIIIIIAIALTALLINRPSHAIRIAMKVFIIAVYLWIAIGYYAVFCAERNYTRVMTIFWIVLAVAWVWDAITDYTTFEHSTHHRVLAYSLLMLPLFYPLISLLRGMSIPFVASPVMPSSVATFTIGLLLLFHRRVNFFIVLLLCHWSLIGLTKTYYFNIPEDFVLAVVCIPAIYIFFHDNFLSNASATSKPSIRVLNAMLITGCSVIGIFLLASIFIVFMK